jgi:hypothetical protein
VPLQSDGAKPYALLFTQQSIDFFFVFFVTWRFIPKDQARIYRMIPQRPSPGTDPQSPAGRLLGEPYKTPFYRFSFRA